MIAKLLEDLDIYACGQHQHNNFFYYLPFQGEYREYREYMTLQKDKVTVSGDGPCDLHSHFGHRWKNLTHRARVSTEGGCRQRGSDDALHKFYMYIYCLKAIDSIHPPTHLLSFRHELAKELIGDFKSLGIALHHQDVRRGRCSLPSVLSEKQKEVLPHWQADCLCYGHLSCLLNMTLQAIYM